MSATNAIGDFDLNTIKLRKKIEFPDGTIQETAATDGNEDLAEVLAVGNDAGGLDIENVGIVTAESFNLFETGNVGTSITSIPNDGSVNFDNNDLGAGFNFLTTDALGAQHASLVIEPTQVVVEDCPLILMNNNLQFSDGTIQSTAYTGSSTLITYDTTQTQYPLTQPQFGEINISPTTVGAGLYQATIYFQLINGSNAPITFNYFNIVIGSGQQGSTFVTQDYTSDFTLANGDVTWRNVSLVFVNPIEQAISIGFAAGITSGAFVGPTPTITKISYILTKLANLP